MRKDKGFRITDHDHKNVIDIADNFFYRTRLYMMCQILLTWLNQDI
jgi:hypothetical protein